MQFINPYGYDVSVTPSDPFVEITYVGQSTLSNGSTLVTEKTIAYPEGTQVGDLAVIIISSYNALYTPPLSDWIGIAGDTVRRKYKVITNTSPFTLPAHDSRYVVTLLVFRGAGSAPLVALDKTIGAAGGGSYTSAPGSIDYPAGSYYLLPYAYTNATSNTHTITKHAFSGFQYFQRSPDPTAYCFNALSGQSWTGGGRYPGYTINWTPTSSNTVMANMIITRGN